jgi:hypothetical protein
MPVLSKAALVRLKRRHPVEVDARSTRAIKRLVHELDIDTTAARFAAAFAEVMRDPGGAFGLVDVKRAPDRTGHDFAIGERFHGCVRLQRAGARLGGHLGAVLAVIGRSRLGALLEDAVMSDYAEIAELQLSPAPGQPYRMVYRYLSGSPIAGSSTFTIEPLEGNHLRARYRGDSIDRRARVDREVDTAERAASENACRFRAVFEFQEVGGLAIGALHRFGIQMHDQVTHVQVERAARRAGGRIIASTIPAAYAFAGAAPDATAGLRPRAASRQ